MKINEKAFHPFIFALFPIFYLYGYNKDLVNTSYLYWPLVLTLLLTAALFLFCEHFFRNTKKSALIVSFFVLTFFSFGHYLNLTPLLFDENSIKNFDYYILLFFWLFLLAIVTILIKLSNKSFRKVTINLNLVSLFLLALPMVTIFWYEITSKDVDELISSHNEITEIQAADEKPDIYYIILDGYGRNDVLKKYYNYDNDEFILQLEKRGFYVANQGHTNYPQTYLSVASSLNYQYINELSDSLGSRSTDRGPLKEMVNHSKIFQTLKQAGYKTVAFPYIWNGTYEVEADIFMQNKVKHTVFIDLIIQSTPLRIFSNTDVFLEGYRAKLRFAFERLPDVAKIDVPTFTYVHFLVPHSPFVFDAEGNDLKMVGNIIGDDGSHYFELVPGVEDYKYKYLQQLQFSSTSALMAIDKIIANSSTPPVIILQSDHGPGSMLDWEDENKTNMHERMSILNAYYLPEKGKAMLYDSITPVNSFRVVLNTLFDADLELLEDRSYFARWSRPYDFIDVTDRLEEE